MRRKIAITGWKRPQLFRALLTSLASNDLSGWDVVVQLEPSDVVEEYSAAAASILDSARLSLVVNPEHLGIRMNPYRMLEGVFGDGTDLVLYLEEDMRVAADTTTIAAWYVKHHRPEWMSLCLLSGGCGSKGFISDGNYPDILFSGKCFNSLGFVARRDEWERHIRPAWLADQSFRTLDGRQATGWDWSVYWHVLTTAGLCNLYPAAARATHTGRIGTHVTPEWHDFAFGDLALAEVGPAGCNYCVVGLEELPGAVRRQASLWNQINDAFIFTNESVDHRDKLRGKISDLRRELAELRASKAVKLAEWLNALLRRWKIE